MDLETQLLAACRADRIEKVLSLLLKNPKLEVADADGYTPLFIAVKNQNLALAALLAARGASADVATLDGDTPLLSAANISTPLATLMLDRGAFIDAQGPGGYTPLINAILRGNVDLAYFLVVRRANVNLCVAGGRTPLLVALRKTISSKGSIFRIY